MGTKVFSESDLPKVNLSVSFTIAVDGHVEPGVELEHARWQMAGRIATAIMENEKFFKVSPDGPGGSLITVRANCFVLTESELHEFAIRKFREGARHAMHFAPASIPEAPR